MKLTYSTYGIMFELEENKVNVFIIEDPTVLVEVVYSLSEQCEGQEGEFVLSEENKVLNISKNVSFVKEPFSIDCNNRKILTKLYQELEREGITGVEEMQGDFYKSYISYITNLCQKSDFLLTFVDKPELQDILKLAEVKIDVQTQSILEKVIEYIKISSNLLKQNIFVFLNLKLFLTEQEIEELYKECFYRKVHLILIEATYQMKRAEEKICVIDKDKCVIYS